MATRSEAAAKKKELSGQISTLTRTLSLGVLATCWVLLVGGNDTSELINSVPKRQVMIVSALCIAAIVLDFAQYIAGYLQVARDYRRAKASEDPETVIYSNSNARKYSFWAKQAFAIAAAVWLVLLLFFSISQLTLAGRAVKATADHESNLYGVSEFPYQCQIRRKHAKVEIYICLVD